MSKDFEQPLSEIWEVYTTSLDEAVANGLIDDDTTNEDYIWPVDLKFGDWEQADLKRYVHERMTEVVDRIKTQNGLDPNLVAAYIFRSVLCGMMWEKERIG
jgi:hypothetical protein